MVADSDFVKPSGPLRLTAHLIGRLPVPPKGSYEISDAEVRPLRVRVLSSGTKTLTFRLEVDGVHTGTFGPAEDHRDIEALREIVREKRRRLKMGLPIEQPKGFTLSQAWSRVRSEFVEENRSPSTLRWYDDAIKNLLGSFAHKTLRQLATDTRALNAHFDALKRNISPPRAAQAWTVLSAIYGRMEGPESLPPFPRKAWKRPPTKRRKFDIPDELIREQWNKFNTLTPTKRAYYKLLLFTGMRREEAARLEWSDIDNGFINLRVTKTCQRKVPLSDAISEILETQRGAHQRWVFPARHVCGRRIGQTQGPGHLVNPTAKGVLSPHYWRHAYTTLARTGANVNDALISAALGHEGNLAELDSRGNAAAMTRHYTQAQLSRLREMQKAVSAAISQIVEV